MSSKQLTETRLSERCRGIMEQASKATALSHVPSVDAATLSTLERYEAEIKEVLEQKTDDETVRIMIRKMAASYEIGKSQQEWDILEDQYVEALSDFPPWALRRAMKRCVRECKRFPSVAHIVEQVREAMRPLRAEFHQCGVLILRNTKVNHG